MKSGVICSLLGSCRIVTIEISSRRAAMPSGFLRLGNTHNPPSRPHRSPSTGRQLREGDCPNLPMGIRARTAGLTRLAVMPRDKLGQGRRLSQAPGTSVKSSACARRGNLADLPAPALGATQDASPSGVFVMAAASDIGNQSWLIKNQRKPKAALALVLEGRRARRTKGQPSRWRL